MSQLFGCEAIIRERVKSSMLYISVPTFINVSGHVGCERCILRANCNQWETGV